MLRPICPKIHVRLLNVTKNHKVDTNIEYSNIIFSAGHSTIYQKIIFKLKKINIIEQKSTPMSTLLILNTSALHSSLWHANTDALAEDLGIWLNHFQLKQNRNKCRKFSDYTYATIIIRTEHWHLVLWLWIQIKIPFALKCCSYNKSCRMFIHIFLT
jgi:hypothetical protein